MVNIEALLAQRVMLLSHERGVEVNLEEVYNRAEQLLKSLPNHGVEAKRINALELMVELLSNTQWK